MPSGGTVRLRPRIEEEAEEDQEVEVRPTKSQRRDPEEEDLPDLGTMEAVEEAESKTLHLTSGDFYMPLITCDEPVDLSYLGTTGAQELSEAIACTRVGEVRRALMDRASDCLMAELCEDDASSADPVGTSIFDHDSTIG